MKKRGRMIPVGLALLVWAGIGLGTAQAGVIYPVITNSSPPPVLKVDTSSTVTVSIFQGGVDVTDAWLPEPGQSVNIVVKSGGATVTPTITLVPPISPVVFSGTTNPFINTSTTLSTLGTSLYPGRCTNFDDPSPVTADFQLTGSTLTPNDCGGMAVIQVQVARGDPIVTFILPQDSNFNGIPDIWEATFCPGNSCPTGKEDNDTSPGSSVIGDGISAFDEYRGSMVSGIHIRTDPGQKDLFVHLVNPQCIVGFDPSTILASTASLLGGGATTFVTGSPLFSNVTTLISGTQVHFIGYQPNHANYTTTEWVDRFHHYSVADGLVFVPASGSGTTTTPPADDRWVTKNRLYNVDAASPSHPLPAQKGLRVIECVDQNTVPPVPISPLGVAALGSPNGPDNSLIYTQRIVTYLTGTLAATCATSTTACLFYSTFQSGIWTRPTAMSPNDIISKAIEYYLAMEIGHTVLLTPAQEGTRKSPTLYGYHHAPGSGSNLDQNLTNSVTTTGNTFYIPSLYNTSDLQNYVLK